MSFHYQAKSPTVVYHYQTTRNNELKYKQYKMGQILGSGGFATCFKAERKSDNKLFAVKVIRISEHKESSRQSYHHDKTKYSKHQAKCSTLEKASYEANFLKKCQHPNIVSYEADFLHQGDFYIVMELCKKGSFGDMLKKRNGLISEVEARYYLVQMVHGLQYLKQKKIIHRDLKPGNYLLTQKLELKIADFGLAIYYDSSSSSRQSTCGTPNYISPEMLQKSQYSYEVDVWSIGVILYSMLYGTAPFETKNKEAAQTYKKIRKCDYNLIDPKVSEQAKDLISSILILDPKRRISLDRILSHPFLCNFRIPRFLEPKLCTQEPDQDFIRQYQTQDKHERDFIEYQIYKRNCKRQKIETQHQRKHYKQRSSWSKKQDKRRKKEQKRLRQIPEMSKNKHQQQMLTSSPISQSQIQSKRSSEKQKGMQFPSQSKYQSDSKSFSQNFQYQSTTPANKKIKLYNPAFSASGNSSNLEFVKIQSAYNRHKVNQPLINTTPYKTVTQFYGANLHGLKKFDKNIPWKRHKSTDFKNIYNARMEIEQKIVEQIRYEEQMQMQSKSEQSSQNQADLHKYDHQRKKQKENQQNYEQIQLLYQQRLQRQKDSAQRIEIQVFPSFKHLLEPLNQEINYKQAQAYYEAKAKVIIKDNPNRPTLKPSYKPVYSVWDFQIHTSSIYQTPSMETFKIVYCLKQEQISSKLSFDGASNYSIGGIFMDNSSIVIRIQKKDGNIGKQCLYVSNVNAVLNFDDHNVSIPVKFSQNANGIKNKKQYFQILEEKYFKLCEKSQNKEFYLLPLDVQKKITSMKNVLKRYQNLIGQHENCKQQKMSLKKIVSENQNQNGFISEQEQQKISQQNQFYLITLFNVENSGKKLYFELNDWSKHCLQKKNDKINHLEWLDFDKKIPQSKFYQELIYDPSIFKGYLKNQIGPKSRDSPNSQIRQMTAFELTNHRDANLLMSSQQVQKQNQHINKENELPQQYITSFCQSFKNKMEYYYRVQKQNIRQFGSNDLLSTGAGQHCALVTNRDISCSPYLTNQSPMKPRIHNESYFAMVNGMLRVMS